MKSSQAPWDAHWMKRALDLARRAEEKGEVPVGAVIVQNGVEIATGFNNREQAASPLGHAEIVAVQKASQHLETWRLLDCELFVTLEPCPMCLAVLQQARIRRVVYAAKDVKGGALSLRIGLHQHRKLNHRFPVVQHKMKECEIILKQFFQKRRNAK